MRSMCTGLMLGLGLMWAACGGDEKLPDVSAIQVNVEVSRFDRDFFAIDTTRVEEGLGKLQQQYPQFLPQFLSFVLGISPGHPQAPEAIRAFMNSYRPVFAAADAVVKDNEQPWKEEISQGLRYWQHYLPNRPVESPFRITTFVGPMDALEPFSMGDYGDVRTSEGVGVALQFHLGKDEEVYLSGMESGLLFDYQVQRFTPETVPVNAMKNMIEDAFPYRAEGLGLAEQMVEKGKRLFLLDKVLPKTPDSLKLGYSGRQLSGCFANEALIWNFFVKNDLLFSKDPLINQVYIKDGPKTQELGEGAPGYIGLFVGRQVVRAYLKQFPETTLEQLMAKPPKEILDQSKYKPT